MDRILIVLLIILMSDHAYLGTRLVDISTGEVVVVNPMQETPNSSVEVSGEAKKGDQGLECDLVTIEGSCPADETVEEFPMTTEMEDDDAISTGEFSDNASDADAVSLEASWGDINAISYAHS